MISTINFRHLLQKTSVRSALVFVLMLLCGDIAFVVLHYMNAFLLENSKYFYSIEGDRSVSEFYQYIKYIWIIGLIVGLSWAKKSWRYIPWAMIFAYFFLDDSLSIHEFAGGVLAQNFDFSPFFGLRLQDFGELIISALFGIIIFTPLIITFWKGDKTYKTFSRNVFTLILVLIFFGVGVDMIHVMFTDVSQSITFHLGVIEDAGEMLSVSLILFYAYYNFLKQINNREKSAVNIVEDRV